MKVRVPTAASLIYDRAAGIISVIALSAALLGPYEVAKALTAIPLLAFAITTPFSIARQRKGEADPALVSKQMRGRFIFLDTTLVLGIIACLGAVLLLILTKGALPVRAGLGIPALLLAAVAFELRARTAMVHGDLIMPAS